MNWTDRVGRRIKLRDLHILLAVAKSGSMGKAAADLAVSQPVVSKAISDLEYGLGVRLLDRTPRGAEPTLHGQALLRCGVAVFDDLRQGVKALEFLSDPTAGELRLGCTEPLAAGFVGAVLEGLSREYPRATFHVITADPMALRDRELQQRNIELAIAPTEGLISASDMDVELMFDDQQMVVVSAGNRLARRPRVALAELMSERWVLPPPDSVIGASIASAFRSAGIEPPRPQFQSFSIPLCYRMVATGRFVTMLPVSMVALGKHLRLKFLPFDAPILPRPTGVISVKNKVRSPLAEVFIDRARKLALSIQQLQ
jgi:DNA-binding transcriptional LysR family regulator